MVGEHHYIDYSVHFWDVHQGTLVSNHSHMNDDNGECMGIPTRTTDRGTEADIASQKLMLQVNVWDRMVEWWMQHSHHLCTSVKFKLYMLSGTVIVWRALAKDLNYVMVRESMLSYGTTFIPTTLALLNVTSSAQRTSRATLTMRPSMRDRSGCWCDVSLLSLRLTFDTLRWCVS